MFHFWSFNFPGDPSFIICDVIFALGKVISNSGLFSHSRAEIDSWQQNRNCCNGLGWVMKSLFTIKRPTVCLFIYQPWFSRFVRPFFRIWLKAWTWRLFSRKPSFDFEIQHCINVPENGKPWKERGRAFL